MVKVSLKGLLEVRHLIREAKREMLTIRIKTTALMEVRSFTYQMETKCNLRFKSH